MRTLPDLALALAALPLVVSCGAPPSPAPALPLPPGATPFSFVMPAKLRGVAEIVPLGDPRWGDAILGDARDSKGNGGISDGIVVHLTAPVRVWRMWSPRQKNRMGRWWAYDAPHGSVQQYRTDYEICIAWNDLTHVASCTLRSGVVVAVGPGNSVTPKTCQDATNKEYYPANARDWQVYIANPQKDLECDEKTDYEADPEEISRPRARGASPPEPRP